MRFSYAEPGEIIAVHFHPLDDKSEHAFGILQVLDGKKVSLKYGICGKWSEGTNEVMTDLASLDDEKSPFFIDQRADLQVYKGTTCITKHSGQVLASLWAHINLPENVSKLHDGVGNPPSAPGAFKE